MPRLARFLSQSWLPGTARARVAGAGVALVLGTGCVGPSVERSVAPNPTIAWTPPAAAKSPPAPATALTRVAPGRTLDLATVVELALEHNASTRLAWLGAKIAAAQELEARSARLPQASVGFSRAERSIGLPTGGGETRAIITGPSYALSQLLFSSGAVAASHDAAREALFAANFSYNQALQDVLLATQLTYFQLVSAQASVEAAKAGLEEATVAREAADQRVVAGLAPRSELLRADAALRNAEFLLEQQRTAVEAARAALSSTIGTVLPADTAFTPPPKLARPEAELAKIETLVRDALERRASLQAAQANVRASEHAYRASRASAWPTAAASFGGQRTYVRNRPGNPTDDWTFALSLEWNIFDGFGKEARAAAARARLQSAQESARAQEVGVASDVWAQYYRLQSAGKQLRSAEAALGAASEGFRIVEEGYRTGINSVTDLLIAQRELAFARQQQVQAEYGLTTAVAQLAHATGALTAPAAPAAPAPIR